MTNQSIVEYEDENIRQALDIYEEYIIGGVKQRALAEKYGLSVGTINNRIQKARDIIYDQLKDIGKRHLADITRKYEYLWDEAKREWETTRDPQFMAQLRGILGDIRKLMGTDEAPEKGPSVSIDKMIMIINDGEYKQIEAAKELPHIPDAIDAEIKDITDETN